MNEWRRLAARIDQHMQQLAAQGVNAPHAIIDRMMGSAADLHQIWVAASDDQLMALADEFPGFHRYALLMQEAFEAERTKASRPYDGMVQFSEQHRQRAARLLATAATLERGYQAFLGSGSLPVFQPQVREMDKLHRQWLVDLDSFKSALRAQGAQAQALAYVDDAFGRLAERIRKLAASSSG